MVLLWRSLLLLLASACVASTHAFCLSAPSPASRFVGGQRLSTCESLSRFNAISKAPRNALFANRFPASQKDLLMTSASSDQVQSTPTVVVAGATGRVGRNVVKILTTTSEDSTRPAVRVKALVRDLQKAGEVLPTEGVEVLKCDLYDAEAVRAACQGADAAVWCAAGFTDSSSRTAVDKLVEAFRMKFFPTELADITGMRAMGEVFSSLPPSSLGGPSIVMCSSAGVTRPTWTEEKKTKYVGAADIPIVRLNPLGILDVKRECEEELRKSGASYCVLRPCGLNDKWPSGRPILSQGDMAVGRTNREDVADVLADLVFQPSAAGKTLEVTTLAGYPSPRSLEGQLQRLSTDEAMAGMGEREREAAEEAQYALLQQLIPGETMEPNKLAMGQTYEQLDKGETGRLGPRGSEAPPIRQDAPVN